MIPPWLLLQGKPWIWWRTIVLRALGTIQSGRIWTAKSPPPTFLWRRTALPFPEGPLSIPERTTPFSSLNVTGTTNRKTPITTLSTRQSGMLPGRAKPPLTGNSGPDPGLGAAPLGAAPFFLPPFCAIISKIPLSQRSLCVIMDKNSEILGSHCKPTIRRGST